MRVDMRSRRPMPSVGPRDTASSPVHQPQVGGGLAVAPRAAATARRWRRSSSRRALGGGAEARQRAHTPREVVAPFARRTRTSRTTRTPATAPPSHPAPPSPPRPPRHRPSTRARVTGTNPAKAAATSSAASPMATTPRRPRRRRAQHRQVEALVAPTGDQHGRGTSLDRRQHRAGRGRLGVVVEPHPASLADQLHAVGEAHGTPAGPAGNPRGSRPRPMAVARAHSASTIVVGHPPGQLLHPDHRHPVGADEGPVDDGVVAPGEAEGPQRRHPGPGAARRRRPPPGPRRSPPRRRRARCWPTAWPWRRGSRRPSRASPGGRARSSTTRPRRDGTSS